MEPLEILLEIVKLTLPGLIVFATVYMLLNKLLKQQTVNRQADVKIEAQKISLPLRMQAYERLSLYCERISIPNLLFRLQSENMTASSLHWAMQQAIQQEFEHNITQQVYVSEALWKILNLARNNVRDTLKNVYDELEPEANGATFIQALSRYLEGREQDPLVTALAAIKKEAALRL